MPRVQGARSYSARFPNPSRIKQCRTLTATALISLVVMLLVLCCASESLTLEEQAQAIDQRLMCPVCPAETIDQSQADVALQSGSSFGKSSETGRPRSRYMISS